MALDQPAPTLAAPNAHCVRFTGSGREYFGIWIVNLLLSIVTLGIYSAWAKVRRTQYFARNTELDGARFDYHGDPMLILKGRLIAFGLLILYQLASHANPYFGLAVGFALAGVMPYLLLKSLYFRLHNLSYRGLRFRFTGETKGAYINFLAWPLATFFSLYLLAPLCHHRIKRFQHEHSAFGQTHFSFHAPASAFYKFYLQALGLFLLAGTLIVGGLYYSLQAKLIPLPGKQLSFFLFLLPFGVALLAVFVLQPFLSARLQNLIWNNTRLGAHRFESRASVWRLFAIQITNLLGILLTLGLYRPFAVTRLYRYRSETVTLLAADTLDNFIAANSGPSGALGDETAEMFDIDIAL